MTSRSSRTDPRFFACALPAGALLACTLFACQMDREGILAKKVCSPEGECARGFTCVDDVCELVHADGTVARSQPLLLDAGAPNSDASAFQHESE